MSTHIDVRARVSDIGRFRRLLVSLDAQSLETSGFTVVAVPHDLADGSDRLHRLAGYRPNLRVASTDEGWVSGLSGQDAGDYVLLLSDDEVVMPGSLERLAACLEEGPDVVVARGVLPGQLTNWEVYGGRHDLAADPDALDYTHVPVLARRERLDEVGAGAGHVEAALGEVRRSLVAAAGSLRVLRGAPVLRGPGGTPESRGQEPVWASAAWVGSTLQVSVETGGLAGTVSWFSVRSLDSGVDWSATSEAQDDTVSVEIDVTSLADGQALARGRWVLDARLDNGAVMPVRWRETPGSALVDNVVVSAVKGKNERLLLDVGATRRSPLRRLQASDAEIEESARGTEMRWRMPFSHVAGAGVLPAAVHLDDFPLKAQLRVGDGSADLHAWLSGLAGRAPISISLAGSAVHPSGFDLDIARTGEMSLVPHEETAEAGAESRPAPVVNRLQRAAGSMARKARRKLER